MIRFIRSMTIKTAIAASLLLPIAVPAAANAQVINPQSRTSACEAIGNAGGDCATGGSGVNSLIATVVNVLSWVVGVAAVIMVLVGGFRYVTSGGDANAISAAKNTILYAIIGLVIALLAQALVRFVLTKTTSSVISPAGYRLLLP